MIVRLSIAAAAIGILASFVAVSAGAQTMTCSPDAIKTAIADTTSKLNAIALTGNTDKDYAKASMVIMHSEKMMSQYEAACGTNPKMKQMAHSMMQAADKYMGSLNPIINVGG